MSDDEEMIRHDLAEVSSMLDEIETDMVRRTRRLKKRLAQVHAALVRLDAIYMDECEPDRERPSWLRDALAECDGGER